MRFPVAILAACVALSACTTPIGNSPRKQELNKEIQQWMAEQNAPRDSRVRITDLGRTLTPNNSDMDYIAQGPEHFGYVVLPGGHHTSDLTLPIQSLLAASALKVTG